jgi:GT2 family glycosyltransferase
MKSVSVVIVNYRTPGLVVECLRSLRDEVAALGDCRVVVVDNASGDGSAEEIARAIRAEGWGAWAEVTALAHNGGFSAGNNAALRALLASPAPPDYVLLLNPDTVVRPGAARAMRDFLDARPRAGVVGCRLEGADGTPQRSAFRFPGVAGEFEAGVRLGLVTRLLRRHMIAPPVRDAAHPTDWVSGAAMMVRREVFESVGLLDESFFLYYEEVDFCRRARRAGWECWYTPAGRVVHLVGQSTGAGDRRRRTPPYWFASRRRYFRKHHGGAYAAAAHLAWAAGFALWRLRRRVQRKPDDDPPCLLWDFLRHNAAALLRGG